MSGGPRYWNEDTQRWEDGGQESPSTTQPTSPPPARPPVAPTVPDTEPAAETPPAPAPVDPDTSSEGGSGGPAGWPVAGGESGWHGPVGAGNTVVDGGGAAAPEWSGGAPVPEWSGGASTPEWSGASWPAVAPVPAPAPSGGPSRRLVWSVVVGAAVIGVAVSLVLTLVVGKGGDDGKRPVAAGSSSAPASSPEQSPSPYSESTASPSPSLSAPPDGYELRDDTEGFRIAVPKGWTRSTVPSQYGIAVVNYRSADKEHRLQVYQVQEESPDASFKLYLSAQTRKPAGFEKLDLQRLDDGEFTGSRLEYLAGSISGEPDVGTWHAYDERFVAADGNIYAIASYGPDSDGRDDELAYLTTALDWFCPPYTTCDADPGID
ncbi:hypothetical protein ACFV29_00570 [Streptomyces sp. NPDC059690]|uniref:hypothetical protein n=1 Tax=Streptomyces sp. NPDC059690 TaxID=3346907 RepID=UPI0036967A86